MNLRNGLTLTALAIVSISLCQNVKAAEQWEIEQPFKWRIVDRQPNPVTNFNYWDTYVYSAPYGCTAHSVTGEIINEARVEIQFNYKLFWNGSGPSTAFTAAFHKTISGYRSNTLDDSIGIAKVDCGSHFLFQSTNSTPVTTPQSFSRNEQCFHQYAAGREVVSVPFTTMTNTKILSTLGIFSADAEARCSVVFAFALVP